MHAGFAIRSMTPVHCGDAVYCWEDETRSSYCVVDALGHGEPAQHVANIIGEVFGNGPTQPIADLIHQIDRALKSTRGAAIALFQFRGLTLNYCTVGNIRSMICASQHRKSRPLRAHFGIVGDLRGMPPVYTTTIQPDESLLSWTDGLPELLPCNAITTDCVTPPQIVAHRILDIWGLGTDDAAVLFVRGAQT